MNSTTRFRLTLHLAVTISLAVLATITSTTALAQGRPSIANLQAQLTAQQAQIATLQTQVIPNMAGYVSMDISTPSRPTLRVAGANLQVVNGLGATGSIPNGLGNVIVGYDEISGSLPPVCSLGAYSDQTSCTSGGGAWAVVHKSGSHNIVVGPNQRYSRSGGLVAGLENTINGTGASVSGGYRNVASGDYASVSGGADSNASNYYASVSGGQYNKASGFLASVSGGWNNTASGPYASVSGGVVNEASGVQSSVSGGNSRTASDIYDWVAGSLFEDF